ncbi:class I SAM-dependent methyltransferase [Solwaraspora sp. WMMD1047]|uniref:class I SAM-dependent methyltransferase n=1 Tax=Solwaraspora sp. WMMD1047 TaxID=3016102 RepID=UPI0024171920|nr:class I SAM-dependent methyltransferase [Solwaraspora sp. WMMD1047]MDG4830763.1 class I SAM-dependent methyltransferase [Solwaraspora sp. WMMD1047]
MPTLAGDPSRPAPPRPGSDGHRQVAESFGIDPERYDRTRPRYPDALVERLTADSPGGRVLDVGCGTGIAARQFQATGCRVLGVEPDPRMAEFARRRGLDVEVATFEDWEPAARRFDLVTAGTAWHWIDPVAGAAKAARILRPGGLLAPFWCVSDLPAEAAGAFAAVYRREVPDAPFDFAGASAQSGPAGYQPLFTRAAEGIRAAGGFAEPRQWQVDFQRAYTRDEWLDLLPTSGALTMLPPDRRAAVLSGVGDAIDALGGGFTVPYSAVAVTAVRTGADGAAADPADRRRPR